MEYTPNLKLKKPGLTDYVNIGDLNENVDILDRAVGNHVVDVTAHVPYGIATGVNAKTVTLNPAPTALAEGMALSFKNITASTGAVTLNVNAHGGKPVLKSNGYPLSNAKAGGIYTVRYSGTSFILQGEGGHGNLQPNQALAGFTFTNDEGDQVGVATVQSLGGVRWASGTGEYTPNETKRSYVKDLDFTPSSLIINPIPYAGGNYLYTLAQGHLRLGGVVIPVNFLNSNPVQYTYSLNFKNGVLEVVCVTSSSPIYEYGPKLIFSWIAIE